MGRASRSNINEKTPALNDIHIHTEHSIQKQQNEYTLFSSIYRIFSRTDHTLSHKTSLNKFKAGIISSIFSNHNGPKLEINYKNKTGKFTNMWKLNNMLPTNQWVKEVIKSKI